MHCCHVAEGCDAFSRRVESVDDGLGAEKRGNQPQNKNPPPICIEMEFAACEVLQFQLSPPHDCKQVSLGRKKSKKIRLRRSESVDEIGTVEKRGNPHMRSRLACINSLDTTRFTRGFVAYVSYSDGQKTVLDRGLKI